MLTADIYVLSDTAYDWRPEEYRTLIENIRHSMKQDGVICIHEPLLLDQWNSDREGYQALWMACYAMTLLKLTLGAGTCYSIEEHHAILAQSGMRPSGSPQ
ncbi:MAG: methyltransferase, partial [Planctomycetota bacterium]|nr:methyltransferase [Planctomycetota bacterium]